MFTQIESSLHANSIEARLPLLATAAVAAAIVSSALGGVFASSGNANAAAITANPISLSGFNQDSVVENTYVISSANGGYIPSSVAIPFDSGSGYLGTVLYESGLSGAPSGTGLPTNNLLTGAAFNSDLNVTFQFQNYTSTNNVLNLTTTTNELGVTNGSTGTLTLGSAGSYQGLAILAMGARGGGSGQVTLNFTDGTSVTTDYAAQDWYSGNTNTFTQDGNPYAYAATNVGRISTVNSGFEGGNSMDETILNLANLSNGTTTANYTGKKIASLTFAQVPGAVSSNIFAVSGFTQAMPSTAPLAPIAVTGFNQNAVVPNTYTGTSVVPTNVAEPINGPGGDNYALYESGMSNQTGGLPSNGILVSGFAGVSHISGQTTFQFQPYTNGTANALNLNNGAGTGTGTLTLAAPGKFSELSILAVRDDGGATESVTLNFADGTSVTTDFEALDWYSPGSGTTLDGNDYGVADAGVGRISTSDSGIQGGVDLYQTMLNLANLSSNGTTFANYSSETLVSMTFTDSSSSGATDIFAISGVAVPVPGTLVLCAIGSLSLLLLRRRHRI